MLTAPQGASVQADDAMMQTVMLVRTLVLVSRRRDNIGPRRNQKRRAATLWSLPVQQWSDTTLHESYDHAVVFGVYSCTVSLSLVQDVFG
jgi:hypothetical protein